MAARVFPNIGVEGDLLEIAINRARLSIDQEVAVWDMYGDHGLASAEHVLAAMKEAKSPLQVRRMKELRRLNPEHLARADDQRRIDDLRQAAGMAFKESSDLPTALQALVAEYGMVKLLQVVQQLQASAGVTPHKASVGDGESFATNKAARGTFADGIMKAARKGV